MDRDDRRTNDTFFHLDFDAFYASVEQLDNPSLKGKALIVGGSPTGRGVVSACSYEARAHGVHSAMPCARALRLCPHAIVLPVRMRRYQAVSSAVMSHITRYAPSTQQISVDEAYLNMTGTSRLLGSPADVAARMKSEILSKFGLVVSIGVGPSRFIAKMASDFDKPDGLHVVVPGGESDFVLGLDLKDLWGLGKKTQMRLEALAIRTVSDLRGYPPEFLSGHFGPSLGAYLFKACRGIDPGVYKETPSTYSVSTETTFEQDIDEIDTLEAILLELCENVMFRAFHEGIAASTATLKLRRHDFQTRSRQRTIGHSIASVDELFQLTRTLLNETWDQTPIRLVGIGLSTRGEECTGQTELFDSDSVDIRRKRAEQAVWSARDRLGVSITKARSMKDPEQKRSG